MNACMRAVVIETVWLWLGSRRVERERKQARNAHSCGKTACNRTSAVLSFLPSSLFLTSFLTVVSVFSFVSFFLFFIFFPVLGIKTRVLYLLVLYY